MKSVYEKGYTLMELLIVIFLLTGLSTVILLSNNGTKDVARVNAAARLLESTLVEAQSYGNSGRACPIGSNEFDNGYGVYVTNGTNNDRIIVYCGNGPGGNPEKYSSGVNTVIETIYFDGGVTVTSVGGGNETHALFKRGSNEVHLYSNGSTLQNLRIITLSKGSQSKNIVINKTGLIYIQ